METLSSRKFIRENNSLEKLVSRKAFWLLFASFLFIFPLARSFKRELPPPLPKLYKVPSFKLTNSFGKPFGTNELKGKVYIANFMFTSCTSICPIMTNNLKIVSEAYKNHPEFLMISFLYFSLSLGVIFCL